MIKISLLIPFHNSEKYLSPLIDSIIAQDYLLLHKKSIEIIFINDHSTDSSLEIIKSHSEKLPNLQIIDVPGKGAAAARNFGLAHATGEYIWFIDADDLLDPAALTQLISTADSTGADLISFRTEQFYEDGHSVTRRGVPANKNWEKTFIRYGFGPWELLIRRTFLLDNNLLFPEDIIHEDMALMSCLALHTDKFTHINNTLYHYRQHMGSVLHSATYSPKIFDIFPALDFLYKHFSSTGHLDEYHDELEYFFIWNLLDDAAIEFGHFPEARVGFLRIRNMMDKYFPRWRKNPYLREKSLKIRFRINLAYLGVTKDRHHNI